MKLLSTLTIGFALLSFTAVAADPIIELEAKWNSVQVSISDPVIDRIVENARAEPKAMQIAFVNKSVNNLIRYRADVVDHWQSAVETTRLGTGDCEDIAILKYAIMKKLGYRVSVSIGKLLSREEHAVTIVEIDSKKIVMDNRSLALPLEEELRQYFRTLYYLDELGVRKVQFTINEYLKRN